jgi:hypothetical protein
MKKMTHIPSEKPSESPPPTPTATTTVRRETQQISGWGCILMTPSHNGRC